MELQINVPTSLNEIPLKHYVDFLKVQEGSNDEEFVAQKMIEIFCGIRLIDVAKIKLSSLNEMVAHFSQLFEQTPKFQPTFKIGDKEYGFIPNLEEITFGEYVDLENNLQGWDNYNKAMAVMYRPIKRRIKDKYEIEEYTGTKEYQEVTNGYPDLFRETNQEGSEHLSDFSETTQFGKQWGWYQSIYALAQGDVTKFDEITKLPLTKCLTYITFEKQKNEIEKRQLERQMKR
jgi:hypothetical protein